MSLAGPGLSWISSIASLQYIPTSTQHQDQSFTVGKNGAIQSLQSKVYNWLSRRKDVSLIALLAMHLIKCELTWFAAELCD